MKDSDRRKIISTKIYVVPLPLVFDWFYGVNKQTNIIIPFF